MIKNILSQEQYREKVTTGELIVVLLDGSASFYAKRLYCRDGKFVIETPIDNEGNYHRTFVENFGVYQGPKTS